MPRVRAQTVGLRRFARCAVAAFTLLASPFQLAAQPSEYEVKAAFLMNFAKFVEWPPSAFSNADAPIAICILGKDPFGHVIDDLVRGEVVNGRRVEVRRMVQAPAPHTCQIVFTQQSGKEAAEILNSLGPGTLTVGEGDNFLHEGGIIAFLIDSRHVRFDIAEKTAEAGNVKLSSKLLAVARSVQK